MANGCKEKSSQNTSSDLANVPRFRIGKFDVWFGYDSGYDSETHLFWIQEALLPESLFPTVNLLRLLLNGCNGWTCQTTLGRTWIWRMWRFKCTSMIYIRRPAGVSSGCSSHVPLAQLRLGLCSSWTDFWFGCQPASQPQPESSRSSASSATQQAASHAASQLQLASPIASHPSSSSSNWASHLASQLRDNDETLCAWRRFATPWRYVKAARDHRVWPTLVN